MSAEDRAIEGTQDKAMSEGSDKMDNQKSSDATEYVSVAEFKRLQAQFEAIRRGEQSAHDKGVKEVRSRVEALEGDLQTVLQNARRDGKSLDEVISDIEAQRLQEERKLLLEAAQVIRGGGFQRGSPGSEQTDGVDVSEVVNQLELDKNDMRVKAFLAQEFKSKEEALLEGARVLKTILRTQPSEADEPSAVAKSQKIPTNKEALDAQYKEGSKGLTGQALMNYRREMRAKGWQG